uniref:DUF2828 domain-containing protein n=1 Tax=Zea mays TaxID=4577 RepID=A0A804PA91_MAIZE
MKNYMDLFFKHDVDRFNAYLADVKSDKKRIAAGALLPHEIAWTLISSMLKVASSYYASLHGRDEGFGERSQGCCEDLIVSDHCGSGCHRLVSMVCPGLCPNVAGVDGVYAQQNWAPDDNIGLCPNVAGVDGVYAQQNWAPDDNICTGKLTWRAARWKDGGSLCYSLPEFRPNSPVADKLSFCYFVGFSVAFGAP